jgi:hypothetical protein
MNNNDESRYTFMLYLWMFNTRPYVYSEHGEPPRKTIQPQDLWLCLGLIIRELGVRYALPDKGWGLTVSGVWTCSGVGVGLAKTWYSSGSFIRCTDQVT